MLFWLCGFADIRWLIYYIFENLQCVRHGATYFTKIVLFKPSPV